jgi:hypothetical protein
LGLTKLFADNNPAARGNATVRETTLQARQAREVWFWLRYQKSARKLWWLG